MDGYGSRAVHRGMPVHTRGPVVECWLLYVVLVSVVAIEELGRSAYVSPPWTGYPSGAGSSLACGVLARQGGIGRTPVMARLMDWRCGLVGGESQGITSGRRRRYGTRYWPDGCYDHGLGRMTLGFPVSLPVNGHGTLSGTTGMEKTPHRRAAYKGVLVGGCCVSRAGR